MVVLSVVDVMCVFTLERFVDVKQLTFTGYVNVTHGNVLYIPSAIIEIVNSSSFRI